MPKYTTQECREGVEKLLEEKRKRLGEIQDLGGIEQNNKKIEKLKQEIRLLEKQQERLSAVGGVEEILNEVHQYIPLVKDILFGKAKGDLSVVIKLLVNAGIDIVKDMDGEISTISKMSAKMMFQGYKDLCEAGFKKHEAFRIILAKIKPINFSEAIQQASRPATSVKS